MLGTKILPVVLMTLFAFSSSSLEARKAAVHKSAKARKAVKPYDPGLVSVVMDARTGKILHGDNHHAQRYPASLTKMMTLYLTFEALENGKISIKRQLPVSKHAASQLPSKMYLNPGESISVNDAILALVIRSANDASVVLAEGLAGSHTGFAERMTRKARELGMRNTVFKNANGWHNPGQKTTAHDMAILLKAIIKKYPRYYKYFNARSFKFKGNKYSHRNPLLGKYPGMDGGKTGFTNPSGFNLAASAVRSGNRVIGVVLGSNSKEVRNRKMTNILDKSFHVLGQGNYIEPEQPMLDAPSINPVEQTVPPQPQIYPARMVKSWVPTPVMKPVLKVEREAPVVNKKKKKITKGDWGVQVGAYSRLPAAKKRGKDILAKFKMQNSAKLEISPMVTKGKKKKKVYRTRIQNIPRDQAHQVCKVLKGKKEACLVFHK